MFKNREEAGKLLTKKLFHLKKEKVFVLGIPRGGVIIAKVIADFLRSPMDVLVVKKLGAPGNSELAIGAVASGGIVYWDHDLVKRVGADEKYKSEELRIKNIELRVRENYLRKDRRKLDLKGKVVVLTDDGVATGATTIAAIRAVRKMGADKIILAVPILAADTIETVRLEVDELIYLEAPLDFYAVGQYYKDFGQVSDDEVKKLISN